MFELIIVIVIMAILIGAMMPMINSQLNKSMLDATVQNLVADLRMAQELSMTRQNGYQYYWVRFSNVYCNNLAWYCGPGYEIQRDEPISDSPPLGTTATVIKGANINEHPYIYEPNVVFDRKINFDPASPLNPNLNPSLPPVVRVIFTPQGSATTDGRTLLTAANNKIILTDGHLKRTITISPVTGRIDVQ